MHPHSTAPPPPPASPPFRLALFARWPDMDAQQHMRNAAYLGAAEDCRLRYLAEHGFSTEALRARQLGPVVLEDHLVYKREIALHEAFTVDLSVAAMTEDARRMKLRNTFCRDRDGALCAVVESVVVWLDLAQRKPAAPPADLREAWLTLARTVDFAWYPSPR